MRFKSAVKARGSDRWQEWRWWLWWGGMHRMRWTRSEQNDVGVMKNRRRELILQVR